MAQQVSDKWSDWTFNLKTNAWLYDPAASITLDHNLDDEYPLIIPLPKGKHPTLDANEIVSFCEDTFGDFLYFIASLGILWKEDLSKFARHGLLTFGAVVDEYKPGILAHFPSTPSPEWCFEDWSVGVKASYSNKDALSGLCTLHSLVLTPAVPSRIDFQFQDIPFDKIRLCLRFSLRLPAADRARLRAAYLSQSSRLDSGPWICRFFPPASSPHSRADVNVFRFP